MIVYNDARMLNLLAHRYTGLFNGFIVCDTGSTDGSLEVAKNLKAHVKSIPWKDFSTARNQVITLAENLGYDYLFVMDADEAILVEHMSVIRSLAAISAYAFPRLEFIDDKDHINPLFYPDFHVRLFPLKQGFHYRGALHEVVFQNGDKENSMVANKVIKVPFVPIFHYAKIKPVQELALKYENQHRTAANLPRLDTCQQPIPTSFSQGVKLRYYGQTPL